MLGSRDPIDWEPRRILVAGVSGSGKTTLARRIASATGLPHTEIDGLYHGPGWTPREQFVDDVLAYTAEPGWVTEWQYRAARPLLLERADTLLWLDLPIRISLARVVRRTIRRRQRREELWNGNRERPLWTFFADPDHIIRWAMRTRNKYRPMIEALDVTHPHVHVVRLRNPRDVETWLRHLVELRRIGQ